MRLDVAKTTKGSGRCQDIGIETHSNSICHFLVEVYFLMLSILNLSALSAWIRCFSNAFLDPPL